MILRTAPENRLDRVEFDPRVEYEGVIHAGMYTFPRCGDRVEFLTRDFHRHFRSSSSNLEEADRRAFDRARPLDRSRWESFLDFYCRCRAPVRIIFEPWEFAMGAYAFTVTEVLEMSRDSEGN